MEGLISVQDVTNIITLVAPGYFALKTYSIIYNKNEKEFSQVVLLSAIFSLPIVAAYSLLFGVDGIGTHVRYALGLIGFSVAVGFAAAMLRQLALVRALARLLKFPAADDDFLKLQFSKLSKNEVVIVKLKNGELFYGTPQAASRFRDDRPRQYLFNNVGWFVNKSQQWEERPGSVIIGLDEIEYFETPSALRAD